MSFDSLGLSPALLRAVSEQGYTQPTPIQGRVIPVVLEGRDVMAGAQTGTGKTAGFTLPLLQRLSQNAPSGGRRAVRALILTPTRELAAQVAESVKSYGKHLPLYSTVIYGGVSINPQIAQLKRGVDILVATPGRLLDHAQQRTGCSAGEKLLVAIGARRCSTGSVKPAVLPVPVWAAPSRSRPASTTGMAWAWMGVGSV